MAELTAVVLAGGRRDAVAALEPGAPNKAFVRIAGVTLLERTLAGLRAAHGIKRIIVVAPAAVHARPELRDADEVRADGAKISQSLAAGLADLPPDELIVVAPSDVPLLSGTGVDEFVHAALAANADLVYACLERRTHEMRYRDVPHTWAKLRGGTYCGAGLIAIRPRAFASLSRFLEQLGAARKSPARLAGLMGRDVIVNYLRGRLTIADCEARASKLLGLPARAVVLGCPEVAVNVDRPSDVSLAERLIAEASSG